MRFPISTTPCFCDPRYLIKHTTKSQLYDHLRVHKNSVSQRCLQKITAVEAGVRATHAGHIQVQDQYGCKESRRSEKLRSIFAQRDTYRAQKTTNNCSPHSRSLSRRHVVVASIRQAGVYTLLFSMVIFFMASAMGRSFNPR